MAFSERDGVVVLFGNTSIAAKINDRAWGVEDPVEYERRSCPNVASYPIIGTVAPAMAITASMCRKETGTVDLFGDDFIQAATRFAEEGDLGVVAFGVFALQDLASRRIGFGFGTAATIADTFSLYNTILVADKLSVIDSSAPLNNFVRAFISVRPNFFSCITVGKEDYTRT